jgi:hypothetical protein
MDNKGIQTITYDELDRGIFEPLRKAVVLAGLMPDVTLAANPDAYAISRTNLRASLATANLSLVEVFGVGSFNARNAATDSRIVIDRHVENKGTIGGWGTTYLEKTSGTGVNSIFTKKRNPSSSDDITYAIRTICKNTDMDRIMAGLLKSIIGQLGFLYGVDSSGNNIPDKVFEINYVGMVDVSVKEYMERVYKFTAMDVFLEPETIVQTGIPVMTTVNFGIYALPETEGEIPLQEIQLGISQDIVDPPNPPTGGGYEVVEDLW